MAFDPLRFARRDFILGGIAVLTAACAKVPSGNAKVRQGFWPAFRERFITPAGRVIDNGNGNISHSEGQGYGMLLASLNNDRETFDSLARWTAETLRRNDMALHAWKYDPRDAVAVADRNNATDGDILIAWALARAAKAWKRSDYARQSTEIRSAIRSRLVVERAGHLVLLPGLQGFSDAHRTVVNPSYYIWSALDAFAALDGDGVWGPVITDAESVVRDGRFGAAHLPCDWIDVGPGGVLAPAKGRDPRFGFDAIRVPLYAVAGRRASLVAPVADWWRAQGGHPPAWIDVVTGETAPYPLGAGGMAVLRRTLGQPSPPEGLDTDYYSAALQTLARAL